MPCASHTHEPNERKRLHPADRVCKVNDMHTPQLVLTKERRRAICVHEAGHAVIHALGGSFVYGLAVAPEGDNGTWVTQPRKGGSQDGLWGMCDRSDFFSMTMFVRWNEDEWFWEADRKGFEQSLRQVESQLLEHRSRHARRYVAESRRIVRAHICGAVAGPAAEQIFNDEEVWLDEPDDYENANEDIVKAQGWAGLLPYRNEYRHACEVTEAALRRPDIWERVMRLADELERVGDMEDFEGFLPEQLPGWPSSPGSRGGRKST